MVYVRPEIPTISLLTSSLRALLDCRKAREISFAGAAATGHAPKVFAVMVEIARLLIILGRIASWTILQEVWVNQHRAVNVNVDDSTGSS